jgi:hypothetical protein
MQHYDIAQLSDPATYATDAALATLARHTAARMFDDTVGLSRGDLKRAFLAGQYPEQMLAAVDAVCAAEQAAATMRSDAVAIVLDLVLPAGWAASIEHDTIALTGPYRAEMVARLKRLKGTYDRDRGAWLLPVAAAKSLPKIFANGAKAAIVKVHTDLLRWLGYVEAKADEGYVYTKGVAECRARGIASDPALTARLDAAVAKASAAKAAVAYNKPATAAAPSRLFPTSHAPSTGVPARLGAAVVVYTHVGRAVRIDEDHPSVYGSHLLGHEGTRGALYHYRPATPAEIAELEQDEAEQQRATAARLAHVAAIKAIAGRICREGERPVEIQQPAGQRVLDTADIYGGGSWFVIDSQWIWYCQNNGADGDTWHVNNVQTGGAGAIGWRVPHDADTAAQLIALDAAKR